MTRSSFVAKIFYNNAGLQKIKDLEFLDEVPYTFHVSKPRSEYFTLLR